MFAWRKKTEGFEWHEYIRTAVRQRRQQRHDRMVEARRAAGQQVQAAGVALVAGSRAAGVAAKEGAKASFGAAGLFAGGLFSVLVALSRLAGRAIQIAARPLIAALARPAIGAPVAFAGGLILGAGLGRARVIGLDGEVYLTLLIAGLLLVASLPLLSALTGLRLPRLAGTALSPAVMAIAIVLLAAAGAAAWYAKGGRLAVPNIAANLPLIAGTRPLEGARLRRERRQLAHRRHHGAALGHRGAGAGSKVWHRQPALALRCGGERSALASRQRAHRELRPVGQ